MQGCRGWGATAACFFRKLLILLAAARRVRLNSCAYSAALQGALCCTRHTWTTPPQTSRCPARVPGHDACVDGSCPGTETPRHLQAQVLEIMPARRAPCHLTDALIHCIVTCSILVVLLHASLTAGRHCVWWRWPVRGPCPARRLPAPGPLPRLVGGAGAPAALLFWRCQGCCKHFLFILWQHIPRSSLHSAQAACHLHGCCALHLEHTGSSLLSIMWTLTGSCLPARLPRASSSCPQRQTRQNSLRGRCRRCHCREQAAACWRSPSACPTSMWYFQGALLQCG